jgi:hypothetical protein
MLSIQSESNFNSQDVSLQPPARAFPVPGRPCPMSMPVRGLVPAHWSTNFYSVDRGAPPAPARGWYDLPDLPSESPATDLFVPRAKPRSSQLRLVAGPSPEQEWLRLHANEYRGEWLALDGPHLYAHGRDGKQVFQEAKALGVRSPFLVYVESDPLPSGGW